VSCSLQLILSAGNFILFLGLAITISWWNYLFSWFCRIVSESSPSSFLAACALVSSRRPYTGTLQL
jgi:hypothetical protein